MLRQPPPKGPKVQPIPSLAIKGRAAGGIRASVFVSSVFVVIVIHVSVVILSLGLQEVVG
jgi:hypothetical protein